MSTPLQSFGLRMLDRARRVTRVSVYVACASALLAWFGLRSVQGNVGEAMLSLGRQLTELEDLTGTTHRIRLNGEPVNLSTAMIEAPVAEVLDRFERACASRSLFPQVLLGVTPPKTPLDSRTGVLRRESDRDGLVACLVRTEGSRSLAERLKRFGETLNLEDVGLLRYAYVKRTSSGRTRVLTLWTDGPFRLGALLSPADRDAPGTDPIGALRPLDSVRLLSAEIEGQPTSTRIYASTASPQTVLRSYDDEMSGLGWIPIAVADAVPHGRAFTRGGTELFVFAFAEQTGSVVSLVHSSSQRTRR